MPGIRPSAPARNFAASTHLLRRYDDLLHNVDSDAAQVGAWLVERGMGTFAPAFRNHKIAGRQLVGLREAHLIERSRPAVGGRGQPSVLAIGRAMSCAMLL